MSALTPKDCNAELSSEEAPPLLLFTDDYSDYCGPIGTEGMGYPGEYKLLPEYGQIQVGKPNNEKS
ncbi:2290_t:CDS:2 [Entrophospora sp. SA101]|nr:10470_t:CDS:2 [Entrophospora candida]CAG8450054.1 11797_t:CDS:2 [Entrophospora candida]CAH1756775.1 13452_t:CDS:2 [Entrophospora sp. SA101]CAJ0626754.1 2290_t:CDS:2 [Entrophospora sp. SA101]CAJ0847139.1 10237_t:CDS:2 [Entrophospora sp. SA101]